MEQTPRLIVKELIKNKDAAGLVKVFFNEILTAKQTQIVRIISFKLSKRFIISAYTRYGKSWAVARGVALYIMLNENKIINLISPLYDQTTIMRNYISDLMIKCPQFAELLETEEMTTADRLKKETSKKRITFKNGCELRVFSAEGEAKRLMGWGGDLNILDESCLIAFEVYRQKISRMMGDHPDSMLVEIGNPWHRDNQMWEHWIDPEFVKIHIDWQDGLNEGRITKEFVEEQRKILTKIEFDILYNANFPEETEDSIFRYADVIAATTKDFKIPMAQIDKEFIKGNLQIYKAEKEIQRKKGNKKLLQPCKHTLGCDIARFGADLTVLIEGYTDGQDNASIKHIHIFKHKDTMQVAGEIINLHNKDPYDEINIDVIGIGSGVFDAVKKEVGARIAKAAHFGEGVEDRSKIIRPESDKKRFMNKKAEQYFRLAKFFEEHRISIPENKVLIKELMAMKYEFSPSNAKIKIIDPDKSPDYADAMVYFTWKNKNKVIVGWA